MPVRSLDPLRALACAFAALPLVAVVHAGDPGAAGVDPLVPGRAMVRVAPDASIEALVAAFEALHPEVALSVLDQVPARPTYLLGIQAEGVSDIVLGNWFEAFASHPTCAWSELVYEGQAPESKTGSTWTDGVDEPSAFAGQYAIETLGLPAAHLLSTGDGVVVAVLDTGLDASHPLLAGAVAPGGWNFILDSPDTGELGIGHGTFVAGLIRLVAPDAQLLPIVVLDKDGKGDGWLFARGVYHAIDQGAQVINLSLGSTYKAEAVEDAIEEAQALGIVVVSAAGNFDREEPEDFPASMSAGFGVAAVDPFDLKSPFSNYNDKLFISAPGSGAGPPLAGGAIWSAVPGGGYAVWEGTSFATALVSGAVALVRAQHPALGCDPAAFAAIESILAQSAVGIDDLNPRYAELLGVGRLDVAAAAALGPPAPRVGDLDADGVVDGADLGLLLAAWGPGCGSADLNGDGGVDGSDLGLLLARWSG